MADIASLVLAIDSTSAKRAATDLDGLAASGARAEAATVGLSGGFKGAGVEASAMAAAAQLSARAAVDQAAGFGAATSAARVNTMAMRESLVVAREISRGNFTRLPGSLTLLAQGIGSQGGIGAFASAMAAQLGLIRKVQDAELAEAATAAQSAAAGVEAAARKAGANILAADTEVALAEAQMRVAEGATAEAAAQARVAAANEAVTAAAAEAAIAENALATAQGRAAETGAASAAATRTLIGGSGIGLLGIATVGGLAYAAIKQFQDQVKDSGSLDTFAEGLNLTDAQIKKLGGSVEYLSHDVREIHGLTVSFGDVMHSVWSEISREISDPSPWNKMADNAASVFNWMLGAWSKVSAGISAGLMSIADVAVEMAKGGMHGADLSDTNIVADIQRRYADELKRNQVAFGGIQSGAVQNARNRLQTLSDGNRPKKAPKPKKPRKQAVDHANDTIARLDEQILQAKMSLTKDATEEANLKVQELRVARDKTIADAQSLLNAQKIKGPEFEIIKLRAQELDNLKEKAVLNARDVALLKEDQARKDQLFGFQTEDLKFANDNATTQAERRKLQLQMLDVEYRKLALDLQSEEDQARINGATKEQLKVIQDRIDRLPTQKGYAQTAVEKQTRDPLQAWLASVKTTGPQITEELQSIGVKGFDSLAQGIAGVMTGTESLGKAFKDVSSQIIGDIVQMTVKMLLFRAISSVLGGGMKLDIGSFSNNTAPMLDIGAFPGLASTANGGSFIIGGNGGVDNNVLSLNGKPFDRIGQGERLDVTPSGGGRAANSNTPQQLELKIGFGAAPDFAPYVQQVAGMAAGQAIKVSVDHTNNTIRQLRRPKISGG